MDCGVKVKLEGEEDVQNPPISIETPERGRATSEYLFSNNDLTTPAQQSQQSQQSRQGCSRPSARVKRGHKLRKMMKKKKCSKKEKENGEGEEEETGYSSYHLSMIFDNNSQQCELNSNNCDITNTPHLANTGGSITLLGRSSSCTSNSNGTTAANEDFSLCKSDAMDARNAPPFQSIDNDKSNSLLLSDGCFSSTTSSTTTTKLSRNCCHSTTPSFSSPSSSPATPCVPRPTSPTLEKKKQQQKCERARAPSIVDSQDPLHNNVSLGNSDSEPPLRSECKLPKQTQMSLNGTKRMVEKLMPSSSMCDGSDLAVACAFRPASTLYHMLRHRWNHGTPPFLQRNLQFRRKSNKLYGLQLRRRRSRLNGDLDPKQRRHNRTQTASSSPVCFQTLAPQLMSNNSHPTSLETCPTLKEDHPSICPPPISFSLPFSSFFKPLQALKDKMPAIESEGAVDGFVVTTPDFGEYQQTHTICSSDAETTRKINAQCNANKVTAESYSSTLLAIEKCDYESLMCTQGGHLKQVFIKSSCDIANVLSNTAQNEAIDAESSFPKSTGMITSLAPHQCFEVKAHVATPSDTGGELVEYSSGPIHLPFQYDIPQPSAEEDESLSWRSLSVTLRQSSPSCTCEACSNNASYCVDETATQAQTQTQTTSLDVRM
eukprot:m.175253 g.175253  ORF g.175253 m.175253 type:complete len:658 (-) comp13513_c0_seq1:49-2022(-)